MQAKLTTPVSAPSPTAGTANIAAVGSRAQAGRLRPMASTSKITISTPMVETIISRTPSFGAIGADCVCMWLIPDRTRVARCSGQPSDSPGTAATRTKR